MRRSHGPAWVHRGFEAFSQGAFDNGGDNLYVNAKGVIEMIHRFGVNDDGHVDLVFANSHGYIERGWTWIYTQGDGPGRDWPRQQLPNDSGWMSRAVDMDGDGYLDLIVINGENGVTSELDSYVYWGGPNGLTEKRTELPTVGAYDVATADLTGNGLRDLIIPSAWMDHHNPGQPRRVHVYAQVAPRRFEDVSQRYGIDGVAALAVVCEDLNGDGRPDLVVANYREQFEYDTDSYVYWGTGDGFDTTEPLRLPTHYAQTVVAADLDGDGNKELIFSGGNRIYIYWNRGGTFSPNDRLVLEAIGTETMFAKGAVAVTVADIDGDDRNELLLATAAGVEIRTQDDLQRIERLIPMKYSRRVAAIDLDGDGRLDLIVSRYENGKTYEADSAIFWNGPDGPSPDRVTWLPTAGAVGCTAADLDGDGKPEIIFNNTLSGPSQIYPDFPIYIYLGNEQCEYSVERRLELPTGGLTNTYVLADLDQDGHTDLAMDSPEGLRVFHGGPDGLKPDRYTILRSRGELIHYVLVADFNRDGWLDLIAVAYTYDDKPQTMANSSIIFWGSPEGYSEQRSTVVPTYASGNAQLADVNKDGWIDIVIYNRHGYLSVFLGGPEGYSPDRMWKIPLEGMGSAGAAVSAITCADLTGNGYLDLILSVMGHYTRRQSGFYMLYGGPDGYPQDRIKFHSTDASSILISVADVNNDGHLDLLVPAYSTKFSRELPAHIFWGNDNGFDFDNPMVIPCNSSCAFMVVDINGNGYRDVLAVCHRNDLGHQVDSLLFWNGPEGLSFDRVTRLPAMGPHLASPRDFGNAHTREPNENYISPPYDLDGRTPTRLSWTAHVPDKTQLRFQLRRAPTELALAEASWTGPDGPQSFYDEPGPILVDPPQPGRWLQYKATFVSLNGSRTPRLEEVRVSFD